MWGWMVELADFERLSGAFSLFSEEMFIFAFGIS